MRTAIAIGVLFALPAAAAELTFQEIELEAGSPPLAIAESELSPDGRHLYGFYAADVGGVVVYSRDRSTGSLTFVEQETQGAGGVSGLVQPLDGVVTPDGAFLIVAARDALVVFERNQAGGSLSFVEAETGGFTPPLVGTPAIAQPSDGASVYVGLASGRVLVFSRNATTGALTYLETESDAGARHFQNVRHLGLSPDDAFLYASSDLEGAVTCSTRDLATGQLTWAGDVGGSSIPASPSEFETRGAGAQTCIGGLAVGGNAGLAVFDRTLATGALDWNGTITYFVDSNLPSTAIEPDGSHLFVSGTTAIQIIDADDGAGSLEGEFPLLEDGVAGVDLPGVVLGLTMAPDGRHLYASGSEGRVAIFATPVIDFLEVDADGVLTPGLVSVSSVAVSRDDDNVYATGAGEDAIQVFSRDAQTGALAGSQIVRNGVAGVAGLDGVRDVVVSPSGANVYVASATDDAVVSFARNASGQLTFLDAETDGVGGAQGLDGAFALAISPDGKNVYVASDVDDAVAIFAAVGGTGVLSPGGFFQDGVGADGLAIAQSVVVSPDGKHVYVGGRGDDAIAVFSRDPFLGTLQFQTAVTGSGLDGVTDLAIAPDGAFLYATGFDDDALVRFARNPVTGALSNRSVTSHVAGVVDGLDGPRSVEVARDGRRLFVTGNVDSVLAIYRRDPTTGAVTLIQAEVDGTRTGSALAGVRATAASRDGRNLYAAAPIDDAVVAFVPEPDALALGALAVGVLAISARWCRRAR